MGAEFLVGAVVGWFVAGFLVSGKIITGQLDSILKSNIARRRGSWY